MKVVFAILFAFFIVGTTFAEYDDEEELLDNELADLAEDDDWHQVHQSTKWHTTTTHHTTVHQIQHHVSGMKQQYYRCKKNLVVVRRNCNHKLHRLRSLYKSYTIKISKARRIVRIWKGKYMRCMKFCWWRTRRIYKGDEICDVTEEEERDD